MKWSAPPHGSLWLAVYLAMLGGIAVALVSLRSTMLASLNTEEQSEGWQSWRKEAATEDGTHGPVQRMEQPAAEPPMRMLLRDHFAVVLVSGVVFPGLILGFFMLMLHGVWQQAARGAPND